MAIIRRYRKSPEEIEAAFNWNELTPWWAIQAGTAFYFKGCTIADRKVGAKTCRNAQGKIETVMLTQSSCVTPVLDIDARWKKAE